MLAESIRVHLVRHSHPAPLGFRRPQWHCLAQYQTQRLPRNPLCCHLDHPSRHSTQANFLCPKSFEVRCLHWFRLDDGRFF